MIRTDPRLTVRDLAQMLDISIGCTHTLLKNHLHMSRVCARWIPRGLTPDQRNNGVEVCKLWLSRIEEQGDAWWKNIIMADESWIYCYTPEMKPQSFEWVEKDAPPPKKPHAAKSATKAMVITFFDYRGMEYSRMVSQSQTVNANYYISVLK